MICRHQRKAFVGWLFEQQMDRLFGGFQLREDWTEWIIEHRVRGQDHAAAMQKRRSISNQVERPGLLYLAGEIDWKQFTIVKNQAEADLAGAHIPEIEAATPAGNILPNFAPEWLSSSVSSRNRLLRTVPEAVYVDLDLRTVVGLLPKPDYRSTMLAMEDRSDLAVQPATTGHLTGNGGDGGGSIPSALTWPYHVRLPHDRTLKSSRLVGNAIKQKRTLLGITQAGLARHLGIDRKTLRSWERGDTYPSKRHSTRLADYLQVELAE